MIKLSKPSKMPCLSWSLQAVETCPGSINPLTSDLVDACKGCYATTGFYNMPGTIAAREHNRDDWKRYNWVDDMVYQLRNQSHFRWFDSGDVYHIKLARKILAVMVATPNIKHWLPTRMYKFRKFETVFNAMNALPNVVVRYSSDDIDGQTVAGKYTSAIFDPEQPEQLTGTMCDAYSRKGKCIDCRACWDKNVPMISYPQHGRKMSKVNDILKLKVIS